MAKINTTFGFKDEISQAISLLNNTLTGLNKTLGEMKEQMSGLNTGMDDVRSAVQNMGSGISHVQAKLLTANAALDLFRSGVEAVKKTAQFLFPNAAAEYETLETNLAVILQDTKAAHEEFEQLKEMGAETPFDTAGLVSYATQLQSVGVKADEVQGVLRMLGDAAQGNNEYMGRIVANYAQILSVGKASQMDMRQFASMGLPVMKMMNDMGIEGQATAEQVTAMFRQMTGEGGQFYGGMAMGSKTLNGLMSTLGDSVKNLSAEIGSTYIGVVKKIVTSISSAIDGITRKIQKLKKTVRINVADVKIALAAVVAALATVGVAVVVLKAKWIAAHLAMAAKTIKTHAKLLTTVGVILAIIAVIALLLIYSEKTFPVIGGIIGGVAGIAKEVGAQIKYYFQVAIEGIVNGFLTMKNKVVDAFLTMFDYLLSGVEKVAQAMDSVFGTSMASGISDFRNTIKAMKNEAPAEFTLGWKDSRQGFKSAWQSGYENGSAKGSKASDSLNRWLGEMKDKMGLNQSQIDERSKELSFDSSGALVTADKNTLDLSKEYREFLMKQAYDKFNLKISHNTPEVNLGGITVNENADADLIIGTVIEGITQGVVEAQQSSLAS